MNSFKERLQHAKEPSICDLCGHRSNKHWFFEFKKDHPEDKSLTVKCFKCAVKHLPMLRRSSIVALVVGSILSILNQGDAVFSGAWNSSLYWKIPLTYCVPFCVATYGALSSVRK